jgi:hypothetical protein
MFFVAPAEIRNYNTLTRTVAPEMTIDDMDASTDEGLLSSAKSNTPVVEVVPVSPSWKSYFSSWNFVELVGCALFSIAGLVLESSGISPRSRPIPYQQLDSTGEYIINQVFNESNEGETVSSKLWKSGIPCKRHGWVTNQEFFSHQSESS